MNIPFNQPERTPDPALDEQLDRRLAELYGPRKFYPTTSCSSALQMAAEVAKIQPGDEVILPSFTYVTTAMPFVKRGAVLVFAEIDPVTCVMDLDDVARKLSERTRAIVPVHYAGISPDMDHLVRLVEARPIRIIEDAAQGIDATYKGRPLGTIGDIGAVSFHHTKNISTGEGGLLILNAEDLQDTADVVYEKGTDRRAFISGEVDRYSWVSVGGSYEMAPPLKRLLLGELDLLPQIRSERRRVYDTYMKHLAGLPLILPELPDYARSNHHIFHVQVSSKTLRDQVIKRMREEGIQTTFHYQPLHNSSFGQQRGYDRFDLPVTDRVADRLLRLPIYPTLSEEQVCYITDTLSRILEENQ